jgi:methyltransferase (TIGR00027 family)
MPAESESNSTIIDPVGATSRATAAARAVESQRPDRLFNDPFASALAGVEGFAAIDQHNTARTGAGKVIANPTFAIRTRLFDDFLIDETAKSAVGQVVLVAAGLDSRAFRLQWRSGVDLFEIDQPEVLAYKDEVLTAIGARATCTRVPVAVDLRGTWSDALLAAGFRPQKGSVWLAEGLTFYLDEAAVRRLFIAISELVIEGDALGVDFVSVPPPGFDHLVRFTTSEPASILAESGWDSRVHLYDVEGSRLGRPWPYADSPSGRLVIARRKGSMAT